MGAPSTIRWMCLLLAAGSTFVGCGETGFGKPECRHSTDCTGNEVCLSRVGQCAAKCDSDAQCVDGQTCSGGGGCISPGTCGSDLDCTSGQVCGTAGACVAACTASSCGGGQMCGPAGHCIPDASSATTPSAGNAPGAAPTCGGEVFNTGKVEANFLTLFDKSGSMKDIVGGEAKYPAATRAVNTLVREHESTIRFGLTMFPIGAQDHTECVPEPNSVPIGDNSADEIAKVLEARSPGGKTPLGAVVKTAHAVAALKDPTRSNFVLMVTDGMETCHGDVVEEVQKLFGNHIKTYVIGFGDEVSARTLTEMATEGGTARASSPRYYQADDPAALSSSLAAIVRGVQGFCTANGECLSGSCKDGRCEGGTPARPGGSTCQSNGQCASGVCVHGICEDGAGGLPGGSTCQSADQCIAQVCQNGTCGKPAGATCASSSECKSRACVDGLCEGGFDGGKPDGAACSSNPECASQICSAGTCQPNVIN